MAGEFLYTRPVTTKKIMVKEGDMDLTTTRKQEEKVHRGTGQPRTDMDFKSWCPVTCFLQQSSAP